MPGVIDWLNERWYFYVIFAVIIVFSIIAFVLVFILRKDEKEETKINLDVAKKSVVIGEPTGFKKGTMMYGDNSVEPTIASKSATYDVLTQSPLNTSSTRIYDRVPTLQDNTGLQGNSEYTSVNVPFKDEKVYEYADTNILDENYNKGNLNLNTPPS